LYTGLLNYIQNAVFDGQINTEMTVVSAALLLVFWHFSVSHTSLAFVCIFVKKNSCFSFGKQHFSLLNTTRKMVVLAEHHAKIAGLGWIVFSDNKLVC